MAAERIIDSKELTCGNCGKLVHVSQLKAIPGGKWVCKECSYSMFGRMGIRKPRPVSPQEPRETIHHFDPFKEEEEPQFSVIKQQKKVVPLKEPQQTSSKQISNKIPYKCTYCKYESRHHRANAFCPNCGKKGGLTRVSSAAEILKNIDKEPF